MTSAPQAGPEGTPALGEAAATGTGELAEGDADRAIRLSLRFVRAAARGRPISTVNGVRPSGHQPVPLP